MISESVEQESVAARQRSSRQLLAGAMARRLLHPDFLFCAGIFVLLYVQVFAFPATPYADITTDDKIFLNDAARMLQGQTLYRDFFNLNFPGTFVFYYGLMKLVGVRAWISPVTILGLGVALARLTLAYSRNIFSGAVAYVPGLLFITVGFHQWIDATHHWFSALIILSAAVILLAGENSAARLALVGALCAAAAWFTQTRGFLAAIGFCVFVCWDCRRTGCGPRKVLTSICWLLGTSGVVLAMLLCYYMILAGPRTFVADTILFPLTNYRKYTYNSFDSFGADLELLAWRPNAIASFIETTLLYLLTPGIYILGLFRLHRSRAETPTHSQRQRSLMLALILGPILFLGIVNSVCVARLAYDSYFALLLLTWICEQEALGRLLIFGLAVISAGPMLHVFHFPHSAPIDLPAGRVRFYENKPEWALWLKDHTKPGEYVYFEGGDFYYLFHLRNPSPMPYLTNSGFTRAEDVRATIEGLEHHHVRFMMMNLYIDAHDANVDHLSVLRSYMAENYRLVRTYDSGLQLWQRTSPP